MFAVETLNNAKRFCDEFGAGPIYKVKADVVFRADMSLLRWEDLNEVITSFVQDKTSIERGLFDEELMPEEITQVRFGKIIRDRYPDLSPEDQEAVRQHAIAALSLTQKAKELINQGEGDEQPNTALI